MRRTVLIALVVGLVAASLQGAARAHTSSSNHWHEGVLQQTYTIDCVTGGVSPLGGAWMSRHTNDGVTPVAGSPYYISVSWMITGFPCTGGAYTHVEVGLPPYTQFAIDANHPVKCFYKSPNASSFAQFPQHECPQRPGYGMKGGASFDPTDGSGAWPSASGSAFEILIPVKTTQPTGNAQFMAGVWMIDGWDSPWAYPQIGVQVVSPPTPPPPPQPFIDYPYPSTVNITHNSARLDTILYTNNTADDDGDADPCEAYSWYELGNDDGTKDGSWDLVGTFANGGRYCENADGEWAIQQNMNNLQPDKPYFWRFCYHWPGNTKCGTVQAFRSAPSPTDSIAPNTFIEEGPPARTRSRSATFSFNSNESNTIFKCKRDGATSYQPCPIVTPTYRNLGLGDHVLRVKAVDQAGNVDATPAIWRWRIRR